MIHKPLNQLKSSQIVRYFFVGGIAAIVDIVIFYIFAKYLGFNYLLVGAFGFILATLLNYMLSIEYVFESKVRFTKGAEILWIYVISLVGLFLHLVFLYLFIDLIQLEKMMGKLIAIAGVFLWNYLMRKNFIFK
jgi:putative flippase GtrA